jgi:cell division protein FtsI (penicillin-binding protein 3)
MKYAVMTDVHANPVALAKAVDYAMGNATIACSLVLAVGFGAMAVAGCGFNSARDGVSPQSSASAIDIPALKEAALSSLAEGAQHVVNAGGGYVAELTIDLTLQRIVADVLSRHADTNDAGIGWAVLMSPNDGAVLALADCGGFADAPRPFALTRMFTPGHLLSTLTVAAALDAGITTPDSELFTDASEAFYHQYKLPGDGSYIFESKLSVSNAVVYSSNVVLSKLGILVGRDKEYDILNKFGIGVMSGIGFAGERLGRLLPPDRWCRLHRTRIPIGQGVEITSIQIARAYATLANHGLRIDPYVVKRITDASGATLYTHTTSTNKVQAVSRKAADSTCAILEGAVKADDLKGFDGLNDENPPDIAQSLVPPRVTGRRAAVAGVRIAGKTSTVQRMKPGSYEYYFDRYIASFAGLFPADAPKYVLVICYETKRVDGVPYIHQGGGRPAMAFAETVRRLGFGRLSNDGK